MKYDSVRVKQKHLILISQHHWSPTTSHQPLLHPPPPAHPHPYAFHPCCFWKFLKIGKKRAIICIANMCFLRFTMKIASPQRPREALYLTVNKKLRHSYKKFGLKSCFKRIGKWYKISLICWQLLDDVHVTEIFEFNLPMKFLNFLSNWVNLLFIFNSCKKLRAFKRNPSLWNSCLIPWRAIV